VAISGVDYLMKMEYDKEIKIGNRKCVVGSQELQRVMENKNVLLQDLTPFSTITTL